jgi:hypothetical protein
VPGAAGRICVQFMARVGVVVRVAAELDQAAALWRVDRGLLHHGEDLVRGGERRPARWTVELERPHVGQCRGPLVGERPAVDDHAPLHGIHDSCIGDARGGSRRRHVERVPGDCARKREGPDRIITPEEDHAISPGVVDRGIGIARARSRARRRTWHPRGHIRQPEQPSVAQGLTRVLGVAAEYHHVAPNRIEDRDVTLAGRRRLALGEDLRPLWGVAERERPHIVIRMAGGLAAAEDDHPIPQRIVDRRGVPAQRRCRPQDREALPLWRTRCGERQDPQHAGVQAVHDHHAVAGRIVDRAGGPARLRVDRA